MILPVVISFILGHFIISSSHQLVAASTPTGSGIATPTPSSLKVPSVAQCKALLQPGYPTRNKAMFGTMDDVEESEHRKPFFDWFQKYGLQAPSSGSIWKQHDIPDVSKYATANDRKVAVMNLYIAFAEQAAGTAFVLLPSSFSSFASGFFGQILFPRIVRNNKIEEIRGIDPYKISPPSGSIDYQPLDAPVWWKRGGNPDFALTQNFPVYPTMDQLQAAFNPSALKKNSVAFGGIVQVTDAFFNYMRIWGLQAPYSEELWRDNVMSWDVYGTSDQRTAYLRSYYQIVASKASGTVYMWMQSPQGYRSPPVNSFFFAFVWPVLKANTDVTKIVRLRGNTRDLNKYNPAREKDVWWKRGAPDPEPAPFQANTP